MPIIEAVAFHLQPQRANTRSFWVTGAVHVALALVNGDPVDEDYLQRAGVLNKLPQWREHANAGAPDGAPVPASARAAGILHAVTILQIAQHLRLARSQAFLAKLLAVQPAPTDATGLGEHRTHQCCIDQCSSRQFVQQRALHRSLHVQVSASGPVNCVDYDTAGT
ncbi:hypothetical protein G6F40_015556 [Rhizopus arrhizus]|nr:hypothetical protein G6F40_015556 [Rhizopus arrhizus]